MLRTGLILRVRTDQVAPFNAQGSIIPHPWLSSHSRCADSVSIISGSGPRRGTYGRASRFSNGHDWFRVFCIAGEPPELVEQLRGLERDGLKQITFHPPFARRYEAMERFSRLVTAKMWRKVEACPGSDPSKSLRNCEFRKLRASPAWQKSHLFNNLSGSDPNDPEGVRTPTLENVGA
jgi:hypothetical protein